MIEFGKTLREAREAKGLTIGQIAETTHMMSSIIEDLENERFSKIAAPIYGRGFVKLYCEAVGIDPKPLIAEFMDIYNGNRDVGIKERPVATEPPAADLPPLSTPEPEPISEPEPEPEPIPEPEPEPEPIPEPEPEPIQEPEPPRKPSLFDPELDLPFETGLPAAQPKPFSIPKPLPQAPSSPSRYGTPFHDDPRPKISLPPAVWRLSALAIAAIAVLWLAFIGIRALHHATSRPAPTASTPIPETAPVQPAPKPPAHDDVRKTTPATAPAAPRTPQKIPPLYMD